MVLEEPAGAVIDYWCPVESGSSCALSQREGKAFVFYSLDPLRGKGSQLGKIEVEETFPNWCLSPDGSRLAVIDPKHRGRINPSRIVLSVSFGGPCVERSPVHRLGSRREGFFRHLRGA